jgi:hypothetical protein
MAVLRALERFTQYAAKTIYSSMRVDFVNKFGFCIDFE